jgi:membrane protein YqaA with SNARE-associated domain
MTYISMFGVAFAAATFLPFYSELLLVALLRDGHDPLQLWFWATLGNTLGSAVNYVLARYFLHFEGRRWFPFKRDQLNSSQRWFNRYGKWTLLLAWAPIGGDALTFIAGLMAVPIRTFLLLVAIGKGLRYAFVIWLFVAN